MKSKIIKRDSNKKLKPMKLINDVDNKWLEGEILWNCLLK